MMDWLFDHDWALVLLCVVVVLVMAGGVFAMSAKTCEVQTTDIGFPHRWSVLGGCLVEPTPSQWVPLGNYRYME